MTELAELLLEKEVIFSEDLERIFGKRKADILKEERETAVKNEMSLKSGKETVAAIGPVAESGIKGIREDHRKEEEKKASGKSAKKNTRKKRQKAKNSCFG